MQQSLPEQGLYWKILATRLHEKGRFSEALRVYRQAILFNPEDAQLSYNLGNLLRTIGQYEKAIAVYEHAHRMNPADPDILLNLAPLYRSSHRLEAARQCYEKILQLDPAQATAQHFLAALDGHTQPPQAPAAYVVELFDQYAPTYDKHMNQTLAYRGPELLRQLLLSYPPARGRRYTACDLGCGTGRSMEAFEHLLTVVDGIDLSPGMLEQAAEKKIYRHLTLGDCVESLAVAPDDYDLFVAADVLPYLGQLDSLFAVLSRNAKAPAFLLMSSEFQDEGPSPRLLTSGRYQHSLAYVQACLARHSMWLRAFQVEVMRKQSQEPVQGGLYLIEIPAKSVDESN